MIMIEITYQYVGYFLLNAVLNKEVMKGEALSLGSNLDSEGRWG